MAHKHSHDKKKRDLMNTRNPRGNKKGGRRSIIRGKNTNNRFK